MRQQLSLVFVLLVSVLSGAVAEGADDVTPALRLTRADLAEAYLRFEQTARAHPPAAADVRRANEAFDGLTSAFFLGRKATAIEALDALTLSLLPEGARVPGLDRAFAVKVVLEPPVWTVGSPTPRIRTRLRYDVADETPLLLRLRGSGGAQGLALELDLPGNAPEGIPLPPPEGGFPLGAWSVEVALPSGAVVAKGRWAVAAKPLATLRAENDARLDMLADAIAAPAALADALFSARARNALLTDHPSARESAEFLHHATDLPSRLAAEIEALEAGDNPYAGARGDLWRAIPAKTGPIHFRVFVPEELPSEEAARLPLIVALHGMGGDENIFFEAYGAGLLKDLAQQRGFVVVTPRTTDIGLDPATFDRLLDVVLTDYLVADPKRVYLIGHSLGAGVVQRLRGKRPERIRAAAAIAGAATPKGESTVPLLVVRGGRDPIMGAFVRPHREGRTLPPNVEERILPDQGHTLLVAATLREVVAWLLSR
jgi:predicted esterase